MTQSPATELEASRAVSGWRGLAPHDFRTMHCSVAASQCDVNAIHLAGLRHVRRWEPYESLTVTVSRPPAEGYNADRVFSRLLVGTTRSQTVHVEGVGALQFEVGDVDAEAWVAFASLPDSAGQVRLDGLRWPMHDLRLVNVGLASYIGDG